MRDGVLVSGVRVCGPLADYADGFGVFLAGQGYAPGSVGLQMHLVAQFSRWLVGEGVQAAALTELEAERFIAVRRARVERLFVSRRALEPVIGYLRGLGVVSAPTVVALSPVEGIVQRYRRYLLVERALAVESAGVYVRAIRPFLASFEGVGRVELERVATSVGMSDMLLSVRDRWPSRSSSTSASADADVRVGARGLAALAIGR